MMAILIVDIVIIAALLCGDLFSKKYAAKYLLSHGGEYEAIKNVLAFRYSENTGAAFGIFSDSRVFLCVLVGVVVAGIVAFMSYHIIKRKYKEKGGILLHVALSFIVAGGLGNLIDRASLGYVRDFIDYTIVYTLFKKNFAICNLADVFLTFGVIMLAVYLIIYYMNDAKNRKDGDLSDPTRMVPFDPNVGENEEKSIEAEKEKESDDSVEGNEDNGTLV